MARKPRTPKPPPVTLEPAQQEPRREPEVNPGVNPATVDHDTPSESLPFPIVAIGASAGGLEAFQELLKTLPVDTGMAFVLIQHLMPTHDSLLSAILSRSTKMSVREVENNIPVEPNHVYVIPPGKSMVLGHGLLQLAPRTEVKGSPRPIDHFMRSLAEEQGHKSIGVVLSGTGNDGTLGMQEIKAAGGLTFAQDSTADQGGMPTSAIAGGAIDFVLPADEIARELARIALHPLAPVGDAAAIPGAEASFAQVIEALADGTDVDFQHYKKNTLFRRVARRMMVRRIDGMHEYAKLLRDNPAEVEALYRDVLINVTSFFRNPEAYESLKTRVFPPLVAEHGKTKEIRVWALGCSTGEEAYSLAMTFTEYLEASGKRASLQIFATDLNAAGIERARAGVYPKGIAQDVSPERLRRFFVDIDGSYRIAKPIRDMCVFARQNVLTDPPFSRLDLVACRNMLIYLEPVLQQRLIPLLHFALRDNGFLWLGGSETIGSHRHLFDLLEPRHKIYAKKPGASARVALPSVYHRALYPVAAALTSPDAPRAAIDSQGEADRQLLARYAPPGVVIDASFDILHFRGDASAYLTPSQGKASLNLLKMLRQGMLVPVRGALHRAREEGQPLRLEDLRVKFGDEWRQVDVVVLPLGTGAKAGFAVLFEEPIFSRDARSRKLNADAEARIDRAVVGHVAGDAEKEFARLSQELAATREYLEAVIEEQEAANEELQSANEEAQSSNEELQSINEELETSKEEIQSSNEELVTLNEELNDRNDELARANGDLMNLMASVQMAIVMVGSDLRIRRFTPMAEKNMGILATDVGRPIGDLRTNLITPDLETLVAEVIDTVSVREREVQDRVGHWYSLRIRPYRTLENRIEGAVLVLVDIDELKRSQYALLESEQRFELLANSSPVPIWVADIEGFRFVNRAFESFVGATEADIRVAEPARYVHPEDRTTFLMALRGALERRQPFEARYRMRRADREYRWVKSAASPSFLPDGKLLGLVGCTFDITDIKETEALLAELDRGRNEFMAMLAHELRNPLAGIRNASHLLDGSPDAATADAARAIIERQSAHMARMVNELLDVARVTHNKIELLRAPVDLARVLRSAIEATEHQRSGHQQVLTAPRQVIPAWVDGDAMRLEQVFVNLLGNASKFTRHGGRIWVSVELERGSSGESDAGWVAIRVRDNGIGIDPDLIGRIFELFAESDRSSERARIGIGVGLSVARRLVEMHGGSIEAFSAGNSLGSEFTVRLPLLAPGEIPGATVSQPKASVREKPRRVLVVDDNEDSAESMRMLLAARGHEVSVVHDGAGVAPAVAQFRPDTILLDLGLPDLDGHRVAVDLRQQAAGRATHIIAVTGFGQAEDFRRSREAGIDDHLVKPVEPEALFACIARGREE